MSKTKFEELNIIPVDKIEAKGEVKINVKCTRFEEVNVALVFVSCFAIRNRVGIFSFPFRWYLPLLA